MSAESTGSDFYTLGNLGLTLYGTVLAANPGEC